MTGLFVEVRTRSKPLVFKFNPLLPSFCFQMSLDFLILLKNQIFLFFVTMWIISKFSLNSVRVFSTTFKVSSNKNLTKRFSLSYKIIFHCLLKSSEIGCIAGALFIHNANGIICWSKGNL